jgi:hypothetical protein
VDLSAELNNLIGFEAEETLHTLALGIRGAGAGARPHLHLILPLDDDVSDSINLVLTVGVTVYGE